MAPNAQIIVAEFCSDPIDDGAETDAAAAVAAAGGGEVSNSWTYDGGEFSEELGLDQYFTTPSVVYFASAGDAGWGPEYPSISPNVVSAGGTHIVRDSNGNFDGQETCWSGSGGGISQYEALPQYQLILGNILGPHRGTPDLAADADPTTGVAVYNTTYCGGWCQAGGTSVSSPVLAGIVNSTGTFANLTQAELNTAYSWYRNPGQYHKYLYDITQGSNGGNGGGAKFGWDQCTGLGSPRNLPGSPSSMTAANEFQVTASGSVSEIDVAVGYVGGTNSFYVKIATDNGGQPGSVLASFANLSSSQNFGGCCGLVAITGISGLNLVAGTNYWVVIGPTSISSTTSEEWNFSNSATGNADFSTDGGQTWIRQGNQPQGAFDVLGSSITLYSNLGAGSNVYQCCSGWQVSGSGAVDGKSLTKAPMK